MRETEIADLSTFDAYQGCGLDPGIAVGDHRQSQALADELRAAGYRGLLSPSAALAGATNLTLFGERYERVMLGGLDRWPNPRPDLFVPCSLVVDGGPPVQLLQQTTFEGMPHPGYRGLDQLTASRMTSSGASWPVNRSKLSAPWPTRSSRPSTTAAPRARASLSSGVSDSAYAGA